LQKKRIAILIDWYLPGNKAGGPVKSIYSLVNLLKTEFDFFIITTNCDLGSEIPYKNIESDKWTKYDDTSVFYFSKNNLNKESLVKTINGIEADFIYLNSFWSYFFSIVPLQLKKQNKIKGEIILAPRGMLSPGALSIKPLKKKLFLLGSKFSKLHSNLTFHATTNGEEEEIKQYYPYAKIKIASNVNSVLPVKDKNVNKQSGDLKLFYLSRIARVKNLHFALTILQELSVEGNIQYDIYGSAEDAVYIKECEAIIKKMPSNIKVNFKGELSFEEVQNAIRNYHFLFLPTLNENFGHSIVESLRSACPVIISDQTPWNEVNKNNCGYAISLNKKEEFKSAIIKALQMNDSVYKEMSENCLTFMEQKINTQQNIKLYKELFS
jgi:glycosyltransferase involved in cell wall biosynthesis